MTGGTAQPKLKVLVAEHSITMAGALARVIETTLGAEAVAVSDPSQTLSQEPRSRRTSPSSTSHFPPTARSSPVYTKLVPTPASSFLRKGTGVRQRPW